MSTLVINNRPYSLGVYPLFKTLNTQSAFNCFFNLDHLAVIRLNGDKSKDFLQGQLSCDVSQVSPSSIRQGALCNLKGRVLSLMDVCLWNNLCMVAAHDLTPLILESLNKVAPLSRVKLSIADEYIILGFHGNDLELFKTATTLTLPDKQYEMTSNEFACCYNLGDDFFIAILDKEQVLTNKIDCYGSYHWHHLQLLAKKFEIYPESRGLFLPHRLSLHHSGYLNFNKGCYKGQEIIARTHFRSTVKHELQLFSVKGDARLFSGQRLLYANQEIGELIDYSPYGEKENLIATSILIEHPSQFNLENHGEALEIHPVSDHQ